MRSSDGSSDVCSSDLALLKILHRRPQDQTVVGCVDAHVIASRIDPLDCIHVDAEDLPAILDIDELLIAAGGGRILLYKLTHRIRRHFGQYLTQPFNFLYIAFFRETLAYEIGRASCRERVCQYV